MTRPSAMSYSALHLRPATETLRPLTLRSSVDIEACPTNNRLTSISWSAQLRAAAVVSCDMPLGKRLSLSPFRLFDLLSVTPVRALHTAPDQQSFSRRQPAP